MRSVAGTPRAEGIEGSRERTARRGVTGPSPLRAAAAPPTALLVSASYYGTLAATRTLGRQGIPVHVADPRWLATARWSRYATRSSTCPSPEAEPDRFLEWLLRLGEREPGQVLLPTNDELAWLFARHRDTLARHFRLNVPPFEAVDTLLNKWRLMQACAAVGLCTPDTWLVARDEDLSRLRSEVSYPLLVKPQTQVLLSPHIKGLLVEAPEALAGRFSALRRGTRYARPMLDHDPGVSRPLLQAFVESRPGIYGLSGFVDESGEQFVALASRKLLQRPRKAGVGLCFEEEPVQPELAERLARLCRHVGYHGVFEVEFLDDGERYLLIDFNPRFYGQVLHDIDRGLDLPMLAYLQALGDREGVASVVAGARRQLGGGPRRYWCNSIHLRMYLGLCLLSRGVDRAEWRRWQRWLAENRDQATDAVASADDHGPTAVEIALTLGGVLRHPRAFLREVRG